MKIGFISTLSSFPWGGSEELWFRTALHCLSKGNQVYVYVFDWNTEHKRVTELREKGAIVRKRQRFEGDLVTRLKFKASAMMGRTESNKLYEQLLKDSLDVVFGCNPATFDLNNERVLDRLISSKNIPVYLISQANFESGGVHDQSSREFYSQFLPKVRKFLFVSERNKVTAERQLALSISNYMLVSNPVAIGKAEIQPWPSDANDTLKMACVARLECSAKGQDILLQLLSSPQWRDRNYQLSLYGAGPDEEYLSSLVRFYHLENKVSIKGYVADIGSVWAGNHLLVLPSLLEGTPLALVEAMLSGRAAVGTNVGDVARYIIDGQNGFISPVASVEALGPVMEQMWSRRSELKALGRAAFDHAKKITDLTPEETIYKIINE